MRERSHPHHRPVLRRAARPLAVALKPVCLAAALAAGAPPVQALPTGAQVTAGQVQVVTPQGGQLVIRQTTGKAGIDWQGFSIGAGERVQVQQPGASSILFNRVVGAEPSVILGQLQANGRVFLSNPRGILFGAGSQVDVGGLVATTLNLDPQALANGRYQLTRGLDQPGELRAEGDIRASGTVALVGPTLVQGGHISGARVGLAAAGAVQVDVEGDGLIFFHMRHEDLATRMSVLGQVLADGGSVEARAVARSGFADTVLNMDGIVRARSIGQREGRVVIDGGSAGITTMAGTVDVSGQQPGQQGGQAELLGEKLLLSGTARIDARGDAGGGTVLVGGNWQGQGPQPNARMTAVAAGAQIDASARRSGDGGTVVVWSDEATRYQGRIAARGGEAGGDGGQVEVSGKRFLDYQGSADLLAPKGRSGRLLLDPTNITIDDLATPDVNDDGVSEDLGSPTLAFADPGTNSRISASAVQTQLGAGSVTLQATNDLFVNSTITSTNGSSLTLQAGNNINVAAAISVTGAGANLTLSANDAGGPASGAGRVALGAAVTAAGTVSITQGVSSTPHQLGADISATSLVLDGAATLVDPRIWTLSGASTVAASLGGAGTLTQAGGGSLVLTGTNSFGGLTINAGNTLQVGNGGTTGTLGGGAVVNNGALVFNRSNALAVGNAISGSGSLTQAGTGLLTLSGGNSYGGGTTVSGTGGLTLQGGSAIGNGSAVQVDAGTTLTIDTSETIGSLAGAGTVALATDQALSTGGNNASTLFSGSITGSVSVANTLQLIKQGSGSFTLTGSNSYAGGTSIAAGGSLQLGNGGTTGSVVGGAITNDGTLIVDRSNAITLANTIGGSGALRQAGAGLLTLTADNSYGGGTTINSGRSLQVGDGGASGSLGTAGVVNDGSLVFNRSGSVTVGGAISGSGSLAANGAGTVVLAADNSHAGGTTIASGATLQVGNGDTAGTLGAGTVGNDGTLVFDRSDTVVQATAINGSGGLRQAGSGTLVLAANNSYAGSTTVESGGTLQVGNGGTTGTLGGGAVVNNGALVFNRSNALAVGNAISGSGSLTQAGTGLLTLSGGNSYGGGTTVSGTGGLTLQGGSAIGDGSAVQVDAGTTLTIDTSETIGSLAGAGTVALATDQALSTGGNNTSTLFSGSITGSVTVANTLQLIKQGSGSFTLTGSNSYAGGTSIAAGGSLQLGNGGTTGSLAGGAITNDGTLIVDRSNAITLANSIGGSGALRQAGAGLLTLTADNSYGGGTTIDTGSTLQLGNGGAGGTAGSGPIDLDGALVVNRSADLTLASLLQGNGSLTQTGSGLLTLTADNTYLDTTIDSGSTLRVGAGGSTGTLGSGGITNNGSLVFDRSAAVTLAGAMTGTGALVQTGSGLLILGADNSHGGGTTIDAGSTLQVGAGGATGTLGSGPVVNQGSLVFDRSAALTVANTISGAGTLRQTGSGSLTLAADNSYGGGTTIDSGSVLRLGAGGTTGSAGSGAIVDNGLLVVERSSALVLGMAISGSGGLTQAGTGQLTLSGSNSYSGLTTVERGTLRLLGGNALADTAAVQLDAGATLVLDANETIGSLSGAAGATVALGLDRRLTLGGNNASTVFAGSITGSTSAPGTVQLVKLGSGRFTLAGDNSMAGGITVADGTLQVGNGGTAGSLGSGPVGNNAALVFDRSDAAGHVVANSITGSGTLTQAGTGRLILTGDNTYGGLTTVQAGTTLQVGQGGGTGALGSGNVLNQGALVFDRSTALTVSGRIDGSGTLTQQGGGMLTLSGSNGYTGLTTVLSGGLTLAGGAALADSAAVQLADAAGATLVLADDETLGSLAGGGAAGGGVDLRSHTLTLGGGTTFGGRIVGTGGLTKTGTDLLVLAGDSSYSGPTTIAAGVLQVGDGGSTGSLGSGSVLNQGLLRFQRGNALLVANDISGSGGLTQAGSGTLTLAGANTYAGLTLVAAGVLATQGAERLPDAGAVQVANGAQLQLGGNEAIGSLADATGQVADGSARVLLGSFTLAAGDASDTRFGGVIDGSGGFTKTGSGRFTLAGLNSYTGLTLVAAGTLATEGGSAGHLDDRSALQIANGAVLALGGAETVASLADADGQAADGSARLLLGTHTLTLGDANSTVYTGQLVGSGGAGRLVKQGSGMFTLAQPGANSHGGTSVLDGVLRLSSDAQLGVAGAGLLLDGGSLRVDNSFALAAGRVITLQGAGGTIDVAAGQTLAYEGGTADGSSAGRLTKTGGGTLLLAGANGHTGLTRIEAGTLATGAAQRLSDAGALQLANGAVLVLGGDETIASLADLAGLQADGSAQVALGAHTLTTGDATDTVFSGRLDGVGGLTKLGSGRFTLAGAQAYTGLTLVEAGTLATDAADRLADATRVQIANGAMLWLGGAETVAGFDDRAGQAADGSARLRIASGLLTSADAADHLFSGRIEGDGGLAKAGGGTLTLAGSADNSYTGPTQVLGGVLAIGRDGHLGAAPGSASPAHLLLDGGTLRIGSSMTLAANRGLALQGSGGTLDVAAGQTLSYDGVMADGNSRGVLLKTGEGTLVLGGASIYGGSTTVQAGLLQTVGSERLPDGTALTIAAGASLQLGGSQTLQSIDAQGAVTLAGSVTTSGDQTYAAPVTVAATGPIRLAAGGAITATAAGNRWNTSAAQPLSIDAASLQLSSADAAGVHADLVLGDLRLSAGSSRIDGGLLTLAGTWSLEGTAQLALVAHAAPSYAPADVAVGVVDPAGRSLHFASDVIVQAEGSSITSAADTSLLLLSLAGGSIRLGQVANDLRGGLSALSANDATLSPTSFGSAWQPNTSGDANNLALPARQSVITLAGQNLRIGNQTVAIDGTPVPVDGVAADLVRITAGSLRTDPGSVIRARLWYNDEAFGTVRSTPGLQLTLLDPAAYTLEGSFGNSDAPIAVDVGAIGTDAPRAGLSAGFVQVLPKNGARGSTAVYLTGPRIGAGLYSFFHDGAGLLSEVPVLYNGFLPASPQLSGSLSSVASVSEQARKERFEEAVRTENVAVRLRAGVIAEVGPGRPATQGSDGIRLPEQCDPPWPALDCPK